MVRSAEIRGHPGDRRAHEPRRTDPRMGGGLRDGRRAVLDCDAAARAARRAAASGQRQDPRDRRPQGVARSGERRRLLRGAGRRHQPRSARALLHADAARLSDFADGPRQHPIRDAPFTKLDLVCCRNLLIYFQPHAQKTVLTLFHFSLKPGGFLFLGSSESPGGLLDELDTIDEHSKIYRKRRDINLPRDFKLPLPRSGALARAHAFVPSPPRPAVAAQTLAVYDRLLDRFMPPSFLVDGDGQLVDTFGGVEVLLKIRARRPSQLLTDLVTGDLRAVVSGLLHRVRRDAESVRYPAVQIPGHAKPFALVAEPMRDSHGIVTHILVSFADAEAGTAPVVPPFTDVPPPSVERTLDPSTDGDLFAAPLTFDQVRALEEELAYTKEHLQAAVQEHETANEELQSEEHTSELQS